MSEDLNNSPESWPTKNYFLEVALGNIVSHTGKNVAGHNPDVNATEETIWDYTGIYPYLGSDTTLYVSSSNAADVDVDIVVFGMNDLYAEIISAGNTDGQNQSAISPDLFRTFIVAVIGSTAPLGDLYIAESDSLTDGVPDTPSKIKAKINIGNNITRMALITVPAGQTVAPTFIRGSVGRGHDATITVYARPFGGVFWALNPFQVYQSSFEFDLSKAGITFEEKTDIEIRGSSSVNSAISAEVDGIFVNNV